MKMPLPHYGQGSTRALHYNRDALWRLRIEFGNSSRELPEYFPVTVVCFSVFDRARPRSVTCSGGGRAVSTFHHDPSVAKSLDIDGQKTFERHAHRAVNPPREGANMRKPHAP
jgi:hypothetical protein